ncbi:response regulator [Chitinophaga horti]|uniref:histidine kinase n=1 Tax=Chitinophaga horti TaxID=2920382 RepID=A0ABY6J4R7_9BACT|nr:response regulator [Chitinophaga horti]UYQ94495.1 response regulator [Chitinophaga horti]
MKLLLVEDEPLLLEEMENYLAEQGYRCEKATDFNDAEIKVNAYTYDAVVLDISLPGGNGLELLELLKARKSDAGVLIVSARDSLTDKISGLAMGADDYITKPFHLEELNARINALLRRKSFNGQNEIVIDDLRIDTVAQVVHIDDKEVNLTRKEYELLLYFIVNKNRVVSKQSIAVHLWGDHYDMADSFDTVYVHTMNLRKKITPQSGHAYIKTVYGMGYKFQALMKLLHRTTRDFIIASVLVLIITGITLYLVLQNQVTTEMREHLALETRLAAEYVKVGKPPGYPFTQITPTTAPANSEPVFGNVVLHDRQQGDYENYYYMDVIREFGGRNYRIRAMTNYIGWDKYMFTISLTFLITAGLLLLSGAMINYFNSRKIWSPFFLNLDSLRQYSVSSPEKLKLYDSPIREFKDLQRSLKELADRSQREYRALREFTENASHELQTPLGIIQSKLDRISQFPVNEEMAIHIEQARTGVERLKKLNRNLLLLAKLDNNAFADRRPVALHDLLEQQYLLMEDLFAAKQINVVMQIGHATLQCNPYLAEVMISNLYSNALRYTPENGTLRITSDHKSLHISNNGAPLDFAPERLFDRFSKGRGNLQSTGLGLAIVQQICLTNGWKVKYDYADERHVFTVKFTA